LDPESSFQQVKEIASKENKLIFVDAYTTWCGPCKQMAAKTFPDVLVGKYFNDNFVSVKIDMEKGEGIELAKLWQIRAYPTLLWVAADGEVAHRALGFHKPTELLMAGRTARDPEERLLSYQKRFEGGNYAPEFITKYLAKLSEAGLDPSQAITLFFEKMGPEVMTKEDYFKLFEDYGTLKNRREVDYLAANQDQFIKQYTFERLQSKLTNLFYNPLIVAHLGGDQQGEQSLEGLKANLARFKYKPYEWILLATSVEAAKRQGQWDSFFEQAFDLHKKFPEYDSPTVLNSHAWTAYEESSNAKVLSEASRWAEKACKLDPSYEHLDTWASVLFKQGKKKLALEKATLAIKKGIESGEEVGVTQELVKKIKGLK
jgi:thiol-disulfide isomerase/thioredoxin